MLKTTMKVEIHSSVLSSVDDSSFRRQSRNQSKRSLTTAVSVEVEVLLSGVELWSRFHLSLPRCLKGV